VSNKVRAESIHARFVALVTFFEDGVDLSRSCLDTEDEGREWEMREGASPPRARCMRW